MKSSLPIILTVLLLIGAGYFFMSNMSTPSSESNGKQKVGPTTKTTEPLILGPFKGKLPCADCTGLETELTLTRSSTGSAEGTYLMKENYLGKSVEPIKSSGNWTTLRGTPKDPDAVVYQLDPDKPEESQYYLKVSDNQIKMLDREQNDIEGLFNYILTK